MLMELCPSAFDPKPFIRTLEMAVDQLISVRKDVQTRTEQMEKSVKVAEREYSKKMTELNRGFEVSARGEFRAIRLIRWVRLSVNPSLAWKRR
jgi:hypothetical protein